MTGNSRVFAALSIIALLAAVVLLRYGRGFLIPLVLSWLISTALEPLVAWLTRRHLPRLAATTTVMLLFAGIVGVGGYGLSNQALAIVEELPGALRTMRGQIQESRERGGTLETIEQATSELGRTSEDLSNAAAPAAPAAPLPAPANSPAVDLSDFFWWGSTSLLALAGHAVVIFFLIFFLLLSGDLFRRKLLKIGGQSLARRRVTVEVLDQIDAQIKRYLVVRLITSIVVGTATWMALAWIGVDHPAVWGIVAGICNSIPYLGPVIVSGGLGIVGLLQFGSMSMAALVAGVALVITSLEGWLLEPPLMGRVQRMNTIAILVGIVFWTTVWGAWGALLAVPMLSVMKAIADHVEDLQPMSELLGE